MLDIAVGITTWKKRINELYTKICIFRLVAEQDCNVNYKICLVLSEDEFPSKEKGIPKWINELSIACDKFEIIWVKQNTRAWKKLDPVMNKYPNIPVITTDDNKLLKKNAIQTLYNEYKKYKCILSCKNAWGFIGRTKEFITGTPRLYPPHSLYDLPVEYFMLDFHGLQADVFNAIRAVLKGTPSKKLPYDLIEHYFTESDKTSLRNEYLRTDWKRYQLIFFSKHKDLISIWNRNIK